MTKLLAALPPILSSGLRDALRSGYGRRDLRSDLMAGIVVAVVALPLSMALAIASGVPPQHGLYTAIIAGGLIAVAGGSRFQVSGPTAAFVVILAPISAKFGIAGLMVATLIAGVLQMAMGFARLGRAVEYIPNPVTTGFTAGIAVVIATTQVEPFLGLTVEGRPEHYLEKITALVDALPTVHSADLWIGLLTLALLVVVPKVTRRVPAALVALPVAAIAAFALTSLVSDFHVATINSKFSYVADGVRHSGIPQLPPLPGLPWLQAGPDGKPLEFSYDLGKALTTAGFVIAMLGAIESLLSAVVADAVTGTKHDPDGELVAQGLGNVAAPFFGGFAATGALARTATNIRAGAKSPLSGIFHALFLLVAVVALAPLLGYLPMASLAAMLFIVAWNMSEYRHFTHTVKVAPRSDVFVLVTCFTLTVLTDMVIAVAVGIGLATLIFMRRMAELGGSRIFEEHHHALAAPLPEGVLVYEVAGPLFFGAAQRATRALQSVGDHVRVLILDVSSVPVIDATGLVNLESAIDRLRRQKTFVIVAGVQPGPLRVLVRAGWRERRDHLAVRRTLQGAVDLSEQMLRKRDVPK